MQVVRTDTWPIGSASRVFAFAALGLALITGKAPKLAAQPSHAIAQDKHSRWTRDGGTPIPVYDVAQARDVHLWVAAEPLSNSARHAKAANAEITNRFDAGRFVLTALDDGVRIPDAYIRDGGRDGHSGLPSMRERPARIGIALAIARFDGGGTSVTPVVPSRVAFACLEKQNRFEPWCEGWRAKP